MILFIKNIEIEGPETIGRFFRERGYSTQEIDLSQGDPLPADLSSLEAVVCLGGPMNVYEEEKYPYLKAEDIFIRAVLDKNIPFLGICLGSQLLAKACGAQVTKSPQKELGFDTVQLTQQGQKDPLFEGVAEGIEVFQWHEDTFAIPPRGQLLATAANCPHQAFKVGLAYGLQFHIEITDKSIGEWSDRYFKNGDPASRQKKQVLLDDYDQKKEDFHRVAGQIYQNFLTLMSKNNVTYRSGSD